mmetsp:Transcript_22024/g.45864  ORF Transcript_22024/g.45864 Transcript_22024/m.45864 type:complete len:87 (+) Transcript_22024:212-472(+)
MRRGFAPFLFVFDDRDWEIMSFFDTVFSKIHRYWAQLTVTHRSFPSTIHASTLSPCLTAIECPTFNTYHPFRKKGDKQIVNIFQNL